MGEQAAFSVPERPVKRQSLMVEEMQGEGDFVFVDNETGTSISLNTVGATILELCDGSHSEASIAQLVAESTGGDSEQVASDVHEILLEFAAYGLFEE